MKKILYFLPVLLLTISIGCQKFLDEKPNSRVAVPETLIDLQALLDRSENMNDRTPTLGEAAADDYFLSRQNYDRVGNRGQSVYVWKQIPYSFNNDWAFSYNTVNIANVCLDQLIKIDRTEQNATSWDNVRGSALFYRSWGFLNLLWIHAKAYDDGTANSDLGIVLRLNSDFNEKSVRASVADSYSQIIRDLEEAIDLLPVQARHVVRPSKIAAYALLARVYVSMRKYDLALDYANKTLSQKNDLIDYNDIELDLYNPFESFNTEVLFHTSVSMFSMPNARADYAFVDTILYSYYDDKDLRKQLFFNQNVTYQSFKGSYVNGSFSNPMFTGITTAEMYLIRAECYARFDKVDAAMADLNALLTKRRLGNEPYQGAKPKNKEETLEVILRERRKELLFRGLRWIDIKRLNKEGANITLKRIVDGEEFQLPPNDNRYALPLPIDIIDISGIEQNPV